MTIGRWLGWAFVLLFSVASGRSEAAGPSCDAGKCVNLVFDGDSTSAGAGASPGHGLDTRVAAIVGADVRWHNVAASEGPVSECLRLYSQLVTPSFDRFEPSSIIMLHAGDNDIAHGRDAAQTYAAFTAYVASAHQQGWKVVVSTELQRPEWHPPQSTELTAYNARLLENKAGADAVVNFDLDRRMTEMSVRHDPALFTQDGVHPSDGGYALLADMLAPAVKQVAGR